MPTYEAAITCGCSLNLFIWDCCRCNRGAASKDPGPIGDLSKRKLEWTRLRSLAMLGSGPQGNFMAEYGTTRVPDADDAGGAGGGGFIPRLLRMPSDSAFKRGST